jgi:hypothetical protein
MRLSKKYYLYWFSLRSYAVMLLEFFKILFLYCRMRSIVSIFTLNLDSIFKYNQTTLISSLNQQIYKSFNFLADVSSSIAQIRRNGSLLN